MDEVMLMPCKLLRWTGFDPQPGVVEAQFTDIHGKPWTVERKWVWFHGLADEVTPESSYPVDALGEVDLLSRRPSPEGWVASVIPCATGSAGYDITIEVWDSLLQPVTGLR